jgi:hypothetical protein
MNKTFAGFWRDGAVVKPTIEHCHAKNYVVAKDKKTGEVSCAFLHSGRKWKEVYWLDTTTPTELSPQEAFELVKIIWPKATSIEPDSGNDGDCLVNDYNTSCVNWGTFTEYPPRKRWRVPTDAEKGKKCRFRDHVDKDWTEIESAKFICTWRDGFMIEYITGSLTSWRYCEVLDEAA